MDSRVRASQEQLFTLLEYMESHGDLARPLTGAQGRLRSDRLWSDLTNILNAVGGGVSKTTEKWKKVWADLKSKTKKKALTLRRHASGTGGGPSSRQTLSAFDERILAIIGPLAVEGQSSIEELGFNRSQSSAPADGERDDPALSVYENELYLEIIDEQPPTETPPPINTQPPSSSHLTSMPRTEEPGPAPRPPLGQPTPAIPSRQEQPSATPAPATPTRRRLPAPRAPASPSARRRPRATTPASSQSAASPRRPRVRARRRHGLTPFERAASEFTAVEMRRLELEETRQRQLHERDMRALEVEHERNLMYSSLINIAQGWLDFVRSRENTEPLNLNI